MNSTDVSERTRLIADLETASIRVKRTAPGSLGRNLADALRERAIKALREFDDAHASEVKPCHCCMDADDAKACREARLAAEVGAARYERLPIDPTAGDVPRGVYETMRLRGD